jgi:DNA-binding PadR family transcriptional regulator
MNNRTNEGNDSNENTTNNSSDDDPRFDWPTRPWGNPGFGHAMHARRLQLGQRGFLRPGLLHLLEEKPMNGVEIMNKMQEMSRGWYRPSPGSIYPLLEHLEKEGLVAKDSDGRYELTARYREESGRTPAADIGMTLTAMESNASYLEDLHRGDAAILAKHKDRIEKLAKRLDAMKEPATAAAVAATTTTTTDPQGTG